MAADPATPPSDPLELATTVADFAQLLKEGGPAAGRELDQGTLAKRAADLETRGVDGAAQLHDLIVQAQTAR